MTSDRWHTQRGQALPLAAVLMTALVAMLGFVIDAGIFLEVRRELQNAADAGALAGVYKLPDDAAGARALALQFADATAAGPAARLCQTAPTNVATAGAKAYQGGQIFVVTVTSSCTAGYTFGRILDLVDMQISASATAAKGSMAEAECPVPWAVVDPDANAANGFGYPIGQDVDLKVSTDEAISGNFHAIGQGGANAYRDRIAGDLCTPIGASSVVSEPGNMVGPTLQGIADRFGVHVSNQMSCPDDFASTVDVATGIVKSPSVCLGYVPVVPTWDINGRSDLPVEGFALFFIREAYKQGPDTHVRGQFVRAIAESEIAPYTPFGPTVIRLIR